MQACSFYNTLDSSSCFLLGTAGGGKAGLALVLTLGPGLGFPRGRVSLLGLPSTDLQPWQVLCSGFPTESCSSLDRRTLSGL